MVIPPNALSKMRQWCSDQADMQPVRYNKDQINAALQGIEDQYVIVRVQDGQNSLSTAIDAANAALGTPLSPGWAVAEKKVLEAAWMQWKEANI